METKIPIPSRIDLSDKRCPSRLALDLITDKWTPLVIYILSDGPCRYTQLKRQIGGITQKMLTQTLRKMEEEGLASRTVYPTSPPAVEYALTPLGQTLCEPIEELLQWARSAGMQMRSIRKNGWGAERESTSQERQDNNT